MLIKIENFLHRVYKFSGILAAIFLILVAVFNLIGISSRIFDFYIRGLSEYSGYCMAASTFFALAYTFSEGGHIRITLFLEKMSSRLKKIRDPKAKLVCGIQIKISSAPSLLSWNLYEINNILLK